MDKLPMFDKESISYLAYMLMNEFQGEKFRAELDLDMGMSYKQRRFRINISHQQWAIMIVIRLLAAVIPTIDDLWLPQLFKEFMTRKSGIILLSWPTGSGKSTTLAAMVQEVNLNTTKHIITIEDPIEYMIKPAQSIVEQKQLGTDVLSYERAMRAAMRQKPDVIMVWEMRDTDSIHNAITLAETWHLVLSTIHAKSAGQTITKIIDSFGAWQQNQIRVQLAEMLIAIVSQRLIPNSDKSDMELALEIMTNSTAVWNLIRENSINQLTNTIQTSRDQWMILLEDSLLELYDAGKVSMHTALATANEHKYMKRELAQRLDS